MDTIIRIRHVYAHDPSEFEKEINEAVRRIAEQGAVIDEIKYAVDPSTGPHVRGGFGALVIYEIPKA
jgi:hypothetical protein